MAIHERAVIDPSALVEDNVEIGPGVVVGPRSVIKTGSELGPNSIIGPDTTIGEGSRIYPGAIIGTDPQDLKYDGSPTTCTVGARTIIREYCTINRGTKARGTTTIGDDCIFMSYTHVAHDCLLGNNIVTASGVLMGGHCEIHDYAVLGGNAALHQFIRVGKLAMVGGMSGLRQDAPPFMITSGHPPAVVYGVNTIGLKRNGVPPETRVILKEAYRILYRLGINTHDALDKVKNELEQVDELVHLVKFYEESKRGVARGHAGNMDWFQSSENGETRNSMNVI